MKNNGRGSHDYLTDVNSNIIFLKWFDNKPVHLISSYVGVEPIDMVKRWSVKDKNIFKSNSKSPGSEISWVT